MPIRKDLVSSLPIGKKLTKGILPVPPTRPGEVRALSTPVSGDPLRVRNPETGALERAPTPARGLTTMVRGVPVTQFGRPIAADPLFADVLRPLEGGPKKIEVPEIERGLAGEERFEKGVSELRGKEGVAPEIQSVLDIISQQTREEEVRAESRARALAGRRGVEGGTIEQAGVAGAVGEQTRIGRDISTNVLLESARSQIEGRRLAGGAQVTRAGQQAEIATSKQLAEFEADVSGQALFAELDQQSRLAAANLTSDELASIRNMQEAGQDRALQKFLGERGIAVSAANASKAASAAKAAGKSNIISSVITGVALFPF